MHSFMYWQIPLIGCFFVSELALPVLPAVTRLTVYCWLYIYRINGWSPSIFSGSGSHNLDVQITVGHHGHTLPHAKRRANLCTWAGDCRAQHIAWKPSYVHKLRTRIKQSNLSCIWLICVTEPHFCFCRACSTSPPA